MPTVSSHRPGQSHVRKVYGQDHIRLLRCRTCGEECSERRGTAWFNTKVTEEQAASVVDHLGEGCGVRATARLVHVSKDTVARLLRMAGRHAERVHDRRVRDVTPRALAFDEQWSFVKKSRSGDGGRSAPRLGTCGTIRRSRPIANWWCRSSSANGPKQQTRALVHDAKRRLRPGHLPAIFTDAYDGYESAILEAFGRRYPAPAPWRNRPSRRPPVVRWPQGFAYGQVKKHDKGRGIERVDVRVVHGKARLKHVLYLPRLQSY